jgi:carboxyl-terminal processing protease
MYARRLLQLLYVIIFTLSFNNLILAENIKHTKSESNQVYYKQFQEIFELVNKDYVQDPDKQKMTDEAISGMLSSLDRHSSYFLDEDLEDFLNQTKGEFGGIGVEVTYKRETEAIEVVSPIDDLPAYKAGIRSGDYIVGVNDELVSALGFHKAVKEMRGDPGTKVKLLVVKEKEPKPVEIELTREIVQINPIKAHLEKKNIAYVRISVFNENTTSELKKSFKDLESKAKGNIQGIILDLRNNPGGLLTQAVSVSEYFIESGIVVTTKGKVAASNSVYTASKFAAKAPKVPIVVIINSGSASASEIVAGSLQDHKRAIILGTKSYGKASVQSLIKINSRSAVKFTTAKYYTPNGRSIEAEGIEPDIIIEPINVEYAQQKADEKRFSESYLKKYLKKKNEGGKDKPKGNQEAKTKEDGIKEGIKTENKEEAQQSELYKKDYQFARAYDLIIGLILSANK